MVIERACCACWFRADLGSWVTGALSSRRRLIYIDSFGCLEVVAELIVGESATTLRQRGII
jgi:hypothetical protein